MNLLPLSRIRSSAFSLVEVVLAVGIMALGVVTILGLLPHGLEMSRRSANELAESRIVDQIVGEIQAMSWNTVQTRQQQLSVKRYFDDQGLELRNGDDITLNYVVQVQIPDMDIRLPTNSIGADPHNPNQNLRRVIVKIVSAPIRDFNFDSPPQGAPIKVFTQLVAKLQ